MNNFNPSFGYPEALSSAFPGCLWHMDGDDYDGLVWHLQDSPKPSKEILDKEIERLYAESKASEYARLRQSEYPPLTDFVDAMYWLRNGDESFMIAYETKIRSIKEQYPKPEEV
jgi:hypothetical protein